MTGFGRGVAEDGPVHATVDVRAVNHRYLDLKLRAQLAPGLEEAITAKIRTVLERGAVSASIDLGRGAAGQARRIDEAAARTAFDALDALARTLQIAGPDLALVLAQPGVIAADDRPDAPPDTAVLAALDAALAQLQQMRAVEGRVLELELATRLDDLGKLRQAIEVLAAAVPEITQRRLTERLRRLVVDQPIDPARLAQEIALIAERADVTEELVRLGSHLEQARALVTGAGASGRRLDFLVQEIGRELNTIGSKSAVAEISTAIVEAKAVLEKLREQVQNVE